MSAAVDSRLEAATQNNSSNSAVAIPCDTSAAPTITRAAISSICGEKNGRLAMRLM